VLIMTPMSENDLQAEAVFELALQLSESLAGLIIVAEPVGAEPGEAGMVAAPSSCSAKCSPSRSVSEGSVLVADIPEPVPLPEPPEPLPAVPDHLAQRLATHEGRRLDMGYLADLSDGHTETPGLTARSASARFGSRRSGVTARSAACVLESR
jgi:hypothetical protein